jgi:hypothetical protein
MRGWAVVAIALIGLLASSGVDEPASEEPVPQIEHLIRPLADRASRWRCDIAKRFICTSAGCRQGRSGGTWVLLDFRDGSYQRCDAKGCDRYALLYTAGGIYTTASGGLEIFLKVLNDGSEFLESLAAGTSAFLGYGRCTAMP